VWTLVVLKPDAALVPAIGLDCGAEMLGPIQMRNVSSTHEMKRQAVIVVIRLLAYWCNPAAKRYGRGRLNPVKSLERLHLGLPGTSV
jgi:hypothetical protein